MKADRYTATVNERLRFNGPTEDFLRRRTAPFMDAVGMRAYSIHHLLQEAYLQGLRDAVDVMQDSRG